MSEVGGGGGHDRQEASAVQRIVPETVTFEYVSFRLNICKSPDPRPPEGTATASLSLRGPLTG